MLENMPSEQPKNWLTKYREWLSGLDPVRRKRVRVLQAAGIVGLILVVLLTAYSLWAREPELPVSGGVSSGTESDTSQQENDLAQSGRRKGVYTFLLVGKDTAGGGNTDTMILVTFDTKGKTVDAMSLPRDTMVNVSWRNKKLNTVYNYYKGKDKETQVEKGMAALKTHVGKLTGVEPDFYAIVEWDAVGDLVDAIGGVTFNVPYDMHYDDDTPGQDLHIHQEKGERRLDGDDAMQVIRWRKNNGKYGNFQVGDSGRMQIQQDFLMAVARELLHLKNLVNIPELADVFAENVTTDLSVGNIVWFGQKAIGMNVGEDVRFYTMPYTPYTRGTAYVLPVVDELLTIVNSGLNPYKRDILAEDLEVLCLQANGSLKLTSGTLEDKSLGNKSGGTAAPVAPKPQESAPVQPAEPVQPEQPAVQPEQPEQQPQQPETPQPPQEPLPEQPVPPSEPPETEQTNPVPDTGAEINILSPVPTPVQ